VSEPSDQWSWDGVNQPRTGTGGEPGQGQAAGPQPETQWQGQPSYGQQPPQWQGQPTYGQQLAMTGGPSPTPYGAFSYRPGIIALRPLGFGEFFDGAFRSIQHNPQVMFGLSLLVAVVLGALEAALFGSVIGDVLALDPESTAIPTGVLGTIMGGSIVTGIVSMLATIVLNGLLVTSVAQSVLGRRVSIGAVWTEAKGQLWRLVGLSLLLSAIQVAVIALAILLFVLLGAGAFAAGAQSDSLWVMILLGFLVAVGTGVLIAFFYVRLGLSSPALMMERIGVTASVRRSWNLTGGYFWRNLGVIAVASIVTGAISGVASMPIGMVTSGVMTLGNQFLWLAGVLSVLLSALLSALVTPFLAAVTALLYVDIRMRKEGLDVELIRAVGDTL